MRQFIDITRTLGLDTVDWPTGPAFAVSTWQAVKKGDQANVSRLVMSSHSGTHLDAPRHFLDEGGSLDSLPVERLIVKVLVVEIRSPICISRDDLGQIDFREVKGILFKTRNSDLPRDSFCKNFVYISAEAAEYLVRNKVSLVGIDYLSVDAYQSPHSAVHHLLLKKGILLLEDVNLREVRPGKYQLFCFPLKWREADGAPCRAVLSNPEFWENAS